MRSGRQGVINRSRNSGQTEKEQNMVRGTKEDKLAPVRCKQGGRREETMRERGKLTKELER